MFTLDVATLVTVNAVVVAAVVASVAAVALRAQSRRQLWSYRRWNVVV
jgi:hypothetical protein